MEIKSRIYDRFHPRVSTIILVLMTAFLVFIAIALASYDVRDPGYTHYDSWAVVRNLEGYAGAWVADFLIFIFGLMAMALPVLLAGLVVELVRGRAVNRDDFLTPAVRCVGCIILIVASCCLASMHYPYYHMGVQDPGGVIGQQLSWILLGALSSVGATLWVSALWVIGAELFLPISLTLISAKAVQWSLLKIYRGLRWVGGQLIGQVAQKPGLARVSQAISEPKDKTPAPTLTEVVKSPAKEPAQPQQAMLSKPRDLKINQASAAVSTNREAYKNWVDMPLDLLADPDPAKNFEYSSEQINAMSELIENILKEFMVAVRVVGACPGPVVTRFELELAPGTKVSKISALDKDIARSLSVNSVRIVEVITGKSVIGIEIPNKNRITVRIKTMLASKQFNNSNMVLPLALGAGIDGESVVADLGKMPHLLVAGTTGSGKSVAVNAMLTSLLYRLTPADCKFILIDPKMLELSVYEGIPHLLTPVITDMNLAVQSLAWAVAEMEKRYSLMAALGVRNVAAYNRKVLEAAANGHPIHDPRPQVAGEDPSELEKMPYIVVIIDEFADMIMSIGKHVEQLIARLAQKARAAGIHLILATQRPSVDVITGLIKSNIPSRIAFQIPTKTDSRIILDQGG